MEVETTFCDGTVIIHLNRVVTCSDPMCDAANHGMEAILNRHSWFVSCPKTLGSECPICRSAIEGFEHRQRSGR